MDAERWRRVETIYHSACARDPADRSAYLHEACGEDDDLRREVESLLEQDVSGSGLIDPLAWAGASRLLGDSPPAPEPNETSRRRWHPFFWVVLLAAPVVAAVFSYSAWLLLTGGAPKTFGWNEISRDGLSFVDAVEPGGAAEGLLRPGDRLISFNDDPHVAQAGTRFHRLALPQGETYELVVARGGAEHAVTLAVALDERERLAAVVWFAVSLIWCGVGLFIGFARPDQPQARLAFLAALAVGLVFLKIGVLPASFLLWQPLHMVLGYHFFYRFPSTARPGRLWRVLLWLLYASGAVAVPHKLHLNWLGFLEGPSGMTRYVALHEAFFETTRLIGLATFCVAVVATVAVIARNYREVSDLDERRRLQWVIYGSLLGLAPLFWWIAAAVGNEIVGYQAAPAHGFAVNAFTVAIPLAVAYSVVTRRVSDIGVAIRLGAQYLFAKRALQLLFAIPLAALGYTVVANRDQTIAELFTNNWGTVFWCVGAALSLKFRRPLLQWLDRRFFRSAYRIEQVLLSLLDQLDELGSVSEASQMAADQLKAALRPKTLHLWFREAPEMILGSSSDDDLVGARFPHGGHLLNILEQDRAALSYPFSPSLTVSELETRWLSALGVRLVVPIPGGDGRLAGMLMLGEKESEDPYSANDRRLLLGIATQLGVLSENLQLKERVGEEQRIRHDVLARLDPGVGGLLKECPKCGACFESPAETCDRDQQPLILSLPVARTVDGRYRLDQVIGKGGMGAVYEAWDLQLDRTVAIKILLGSAFGDERAIRRFQREARAAARLNHPNAVSVHDYGALERGGAYLVMERVHGETLRAEIDRLGSFPPPLAAEWLAQLLDGVAAAHAIGIIHRDLKPENVLGGRNAFGSLEVKILDFGLAKFRPLEKDSPPPSTLTAAGVAIGTFGYMPPEQLQGREVDHRCDIFAIGVISAEMLTGRRPFQGETYAETAQAMLRETYHLPNRALDEVLQRCLAKQPKDRVSSAEELRTLLVPALRDCPPLKEAGPRELQTSRNATTVGPKKGL